jgi:hypothetical protein
VLTADRYGSPSIRIEEGTRCPAPDDADLESHGRRSAERCRQVARDSTRAPFEFGGPGLVFVTARSPRYGQADARTSRGLADPVAIL